MKGLKGLLSSRKGTLSLIIALMSGGLAATNHLDGTSLAAIVATVSTIFMWSHTKTDCEAIKKKE